VKRAFFEEQSQHHSVRRISSAFGLSRSSHYDVKARDAQKEQRDAPVVQAMTEIHAHRYKRHYGCPRMTAELKGLGFEVNHKRVAVLMKAHGLNAEMRRKKTKTTDSRHGLTVADNLLARDFAAGKGNARWVSDITYLSTWSGFVYLAVILDIKTRSWLGYAVDTHLRSSLVEDALQMATEQTSLLPELFHADRGSQYASESFRAELTRLNATLSMSRKGNCWDNAVAESFFGTFKHEVADSFVHLEDAKREVFNYFCFYNQERRHSSLGQASPQAYEKTLSSNNQKVA
jgi:transposase InsO family protein